jgi:Tol biopolymer transport system component
VTGVSPGFATISANVNGGQGAQVVAVTSGAPRPNREIGFLRSVEHPSGSSRLELRSMPWSGGPATSISVLYNEVSQFEWAPGGNQIAVLYIQVNGEGKAGLYLVPAQGGVEQLIASQALDPHWSPDGSRLLVRQYTASGESDIYSVRPDGTDLRQLTGQSGDELEPQWSPDGRQFLYYRSGGFGGAPGELWVVRADGSRGRKLDLPTPAARARWAPDAKRIAYDDGTGIWVVNADGSGAQAISPNCHANVCSRPGFYLRPAWSPDGQRLAYGGTPGLGNPYRMYITRPDGTNLVEVEGGTLGLPHPTWSPDAVHLVFSGTLDVGSWPAVFVVGADGNGRVPLTGTENAFAPEWQP